MSEKFNYRPALAGLDLAHVRVVPERLGDARRHLAARGERQAAARQPVLAWAAALWGASKPICTRENGKTLQGSFSYASKPNFASN